MPVELFRRVDLNCIYPPFLEKVLSVVAVCQDRQHNYYAVYGFRSWGQQHQLRRAYLAGKGGRAAPGGLSAHNYGLAIDFCLDLSPRSGLQPSWENKDYEVLGEEAERVGLVWGGSFDDRPHVQWPGFVTAHELAPLKLMWGSTQGEPLARLKQIWLYLDKGEDRGTTRPNVGDAD